MRSSTKRLLTVAIAAALAAPGAALATNGYKSLAFGIKSEGMAGVGAALPQDSIAASNNPAGMAFVGNRFDIGLDIFNPNRNAELDGIDADSRRNWFLIPNFGYNRQLDDRLSLGISAFGNGGMNTSYDKNLYDRAFRQRFGAFFPPGTFPSETSTGTPDTDNEVGVNFAQMLILPTVAYKVNPNHALGFSLVLAAQQFKAYGLGNFQCFTQTGAFQNPSCQPPPNGFGGLAPAFDPNFVFSEGLTDNDYDWSFGAGVKLGWLGQLTDRVSAGISYASRVWMTEFDDYDELFAEDGDFDIPAILQGGIAIKATPQLTLAFDVEHIFYSDVDSLGNVGPVPQEFPPGSGFFVPGLPEGPQNLLGEDEGLGFGWDDQTVFKLGASYDYNDRLTLRAGYAYGESPIDDDQILFNILAPAVVEHHLAVGFTYKLSPSSEVSAAYQHAFNHEQEVEETGLGPAKIEMNQNSFGISYGMTF